MFCNKCGQELSEESVFCSKCGCKLNQKNDAIEVRKLLNSNSDFENSHKENASIIEIDKTRQKQEKKIPSSLAPVLSFLICGLGQIYNGKIIKGICFFLVATTLVISSYWTYNKSASSYLESLSNKIDYLREVEGQSKNNLNNAQTYKTQKEKDLEIQKREKLATTQNENEQKANIYKIVSLILITMSVSFWIFNIFDAYKTVKIKLS